MPEVAHIVPFYYFFYYDAVEMDSNDDTDEEFNGFFNTVEIAAAIEKNKDIKRKVKELINSR